MITCDLSKQKDYFYRSGDWADTLALHVSKYYASKDATR